MSRLTLAQKVETTPPLKHAETTPPNVASRSNSLTAKLSPERPVHGDAFLHECLDSSPFKQASLVSQEHKILSNLGKP